MSTLPHPSSTVVDAGRRMTTEWYRYFQDDPQTGVSESYQHLVDVREYASDIDLTGVSNCASGLQSAITAAASDRIPLWLPSGTYLTDGTRIRVPSYARVIGAGWKQTVIKRTVDDTEGTVEVYNADDVLIQGVGILTTLTTHTLGYGQTGFCARNGSTNVTFLECGVSGELNRKFHCINSARVNFIRCYSPYGEGNATLRIVSDFDAEDYAEMSDENAPIQVEDVLVDGCVFSGASTDGGTTRSVDYGIDVASVINASDLCARIKFRNNSISFYKSQGIGIGGRVSRVSAIGNDITHIYTSTAGNGGTGILVAKSVNSPTDIVIANNTVQICDQGIYSTESSFVSIAGNTAYACLSNGIFVSAGADIAVTGNISHENAGKGIYVTGSSANVSIIGNHARANTGTGIQTDAGVNGVEVGNISIGNGTQYTNNGTMTFGSTGTPAGNA
jgi:parallel beta-helix repeat protein